MRIEAVEVAAEGHCAFIIEDSAGSKSCRATPQPGSAYCPTHHTLCHVPVGSAAERRQLRQIEALAGAVGGKLGHGGRAPPAALLRRLARLGRDFSRPRCSRNVQEVPMAKPRPTAKRNGTHPAAASPGPTPERGRQGPIELLPRAIPDALGQPSRPYRAVDTLAIMERRGSITAGMRQAGEDFRARFTVAQLDPLRALDLSHLRLGEQSLRPERDGPGLRIEAARRTVWRALQAVGGIASPAGSCLWHVLGWERSLKEWARSNRAGAAAG